jgi:hypothetical protein
MISWSPPSARHPRSLSPRARFLINQVLVSRVIYDTLCVSQTRPDLLPGPQVFGPRIVSQSTSITAMPGSGNLPPSSRRPSRPTPTAGTTGRAPVGRVILYQGIEYSTRLSRTPAATRETGSSSPHPPQVVSRIAVKPRSLRTVLAIPCTHHTPQIKAAGCCRLRPRLRQGVRPSLHPPVRDRP